LAQFQLSTLSLDSLIFLSGQRKREKCNEETTHGVRPTNSQLICTKVDIFPLDFYWVSAIYLPIWRRYVFDLILWIGEETNLFMIQK